MPMVFLIFVQKYVYCLKNILHKQIICLIMYLFILTQTEQEIKILLV